MAVQIYNPSKSGDRQTLFEKQTNNQRTQEHGSSGRVLAQNHEVLSSILSITNNNNNNNNEF